MRQLTDFIFEQNNSNFKGQQELASYIGEVVLKEHKKININIMKINQTYVRNYIDNWCRNKIDNPTLEDFEELKNIIIKFGASIFDIDESEFEHKRYSSICYEYSDKCEDRTKRANYLTLCYLYMRRF